MCARSNKLADACSLTDRIKQVIRKIPKGRVASYGQIAALAGNPRAARQVVWALNSARNEKLPWHRVINAQGKIALRPGQGYELQHALLTEEGVTFGPGDRIDLGRYRWQPRTITFK